MSGLKDGWKAVCDKATKRPDICAITLPGACGGIVGCLLAPKDGPYECPGLVLAGILGVFSGIVLVGIITNTNRQDLLRLVGLTFLGGIAWPVIIVQALGTLLNEAPGDQSRLAETLLGRASQIEKNDAPSREAVEEAASTLAESLPDTEPQRTAVIEDIIWRLNALEEYQRRVTIDALLEDNIFGLDDNQAQELAELRDAPSRSERVFEDPIERIVLNHLMDEPGNFEELLESNGTLVTDENGSVGVRVAIASRYEFWTTSSDRDMVAALYSTENTENGSLLSVDDDSGTDLNPSLATNLQADRNYVLRLFDFSSGLPAGNVQVRYSVGG